MLLFQREIPGDAGDAPGCRPGPRGGYEGGALPRTPPEAAFEKAPLDSPKAFLAEDCEAEW